ncbi:MAG TPA: putative sulfate exporter family transporter [Gammaproteobacteria bacterium]|nr:putative sulfate exporter family transporter [Gammaproteobacteria bacterium]
MPYLLTVIFLTATLWLNHAALALILGIFLSYIITIPKDFFTRKYGTRILQTGIVFLGGSISVTQVTAISKDYLPWISGFVLVTFFVVIGLGKLLGVTKKQSYLLASGTAICGGTAMASVAPVIKAKPEDLLPALSIVFILNALAVIFFPLLGNWIGLTEDQFGSWVALAIHDTASVIGAASLMGERAVEVAATLKLGRTLWIVPLVLFSAWYFREKRERLGFPLFILFFILAVALNSLLTPSAEVNHILKTINKICLLTGLFCIGTQIDRSAIQQISLKPLLLAVLIWSVVIPASLMVV